MAKYSIVIQWSDEDKGYIAMVPEFPELSAFGNTPKEATSELMVAQKALIEVYKEDGCRLPEPDKMRAYSGQTRIRIEKTLHSALSHEASKEGVSLNSHINSILERRHNPLVAGKRLESMENDLRALKSQFKAIRSDIAFIKAALTFQSFQGFSNSVPTPGTTNVVSTALDMPVSEPCYSGMLNT